MKRRNIIVLGCILATIGLLLASQFLWLQFGVQPTESRIIWKRVLIGASAISVALSVLCFAHKERK